MYDLCSDVTTIVTPSIEREFKNWDPLANPKQGSNVMTLIKEVLYNNSNQLGYEVTPGMSQDMEPYDRLLWQFVVPKIRFAVDSWNVRQPHLMLEILEYWQPVLPTWMMTKLLDQCIYAKVKAELNSWEPHNDPIPVQTWVQPWALVMEDKKYFFYSTIRDKLGKTFAFWEPYDPTGKVIIKSWIGLFDQHDLDDFVVRHVLPKLLVCLQSISFSVTDQNLQQWNLVMEWVDILPHRNMVAAIVEHFFPSFYAALSVWASSRSYGKVELNHWFTTWLSRFPEKLKSDQDIKKCLSNAVMMMMTNQEVVVQKGNFNYNRQTSVSMSTRQATTKEMFEQFCRQKGTSLLRMATDNDNNQQIYKLGQLLIYFEGEFVYYFENIKWIPAKTFEEVFRKAGL